MKSDSFKNNRKALAALLICTGFIAAHPLAMRAESSGPSVQTVQQQQIKVTGTVNDDMGPVIGASVVEKGNPSNGTITDIDGNFSLSVKPGATLLISYIGYKSQEVQAISGKSVNITLKEDTEMLDEVVVATATPSPRWPGRSPSPPSRPASLPAKRSLKVPSSAGSSTTSTAPRSS